jgi:hypothetical protein
MIDDDEFGAVGRMKIARGDLSIRSKPAHCHFVHQKSHMI